MPLTDDGYINYDFSQILAEIKNLYQSERAFGQQADVSDGSPWGKDAYILATLAKGGEDRLQDGYDASSSDFATGVNLDRQCSIASIQRRMPQYSEATLQITGEPGYLIEANTVFNTDGGDNFISREDVQIDDNGNASVIVDSELPEEAANVDAHSIINQANPVDEIETVDNALSAVGGADLEDDYTLRQRLHINNTQRANSTLHGIETALLNTPGVLSVTPQENITDVTDANNNPPHTMHFYVAGGTDENIYETLANYKGGGTTMVGSKVKTVTHGKSTTVVAFDRSETLYLKVKVKLTSSDGYDDEATKESIAEFINDYKMGDKIITNKLYSSLYSLDGISVVSDIQISTDGGNTFTSDNVQLNNYQLARVLDSDIEVINDDVD